VIRHRALHVATWAFSWLAPRYQREALLGDLAEEYALRAKAGSSSAAVKWYLQQLCASAPPLLWARVSQAGWLATAGVALLAYIAVGVVELIVDRAIASSSASSTAAYNPLFMVTTFPPVVLVGYFATRLRPKAAIVLAAMMLLTVTAMTLWTTEIMPLWYRVAYFLVGPAAIFLGSALRSLRTPRS
jgi:hypothetical protein